MAGRSEYELAVKIIGMVDASLGNAFSRTRRQTRQFAHQILRDMDTVPTSFSEAVAGATPGINAAWNGLMGVAKTGLQAAQVVGRKTIDVIHESVDTGSEFEAAMDSWAATSQATMGDQVKAEKAAREWGSKTTKTATEAANALEYMALAGWSVDDSIEALPRILKTSEVAGTDLAHTSDLVTDSMAATNTQIQDMTRFLDIAAKAQSSSNQNAEQLMEGWIKTGANLENLNVDVAESATALGVLANRGKKGSEAGRSLNSILINLTRGTGAAGKKMAELGLSAFDSEEKFKGLRTILQEVYDVTRDMTEKKRTETFAAIGGKYQIDTLTDLMASFGIGEDGLTEWDSLYTKINDCTGALDEMARTKMDNLKGDIDIFNSALDEAKIHIYEGLNYPLRDAVQWATKMVTSSGGWIDKFEESYPTVRRLAKDGFENLGNAMQIVVSVGKGLGSVVADGVSFLGSAIQPVISAGQWLVANPMAYSPLLGLGAGLVTTVTALKGLTGLATSFMMLRNTIGFLAANPITKWAGIGTLAAGGIAAVITAMNRYSAAMTKADLARHFGDITLSIQELRAASKSIIGAELFDDLEKSAAQAAKVTETIDKLKGSFDGIDKVLWKVKMGIDLTESDTLTMESDIESLVNNAVKLASEKEYAMHLNIKALFGDSEEGQNLLANLGGLYSQTQGEIEKLGEQLGNAYKRAIENGIISDWDAAVIEKLKSQIQELTDELTATTEEVFWHEIEGKYGGGRKLSFESFQNLQDQLREDQGTKFAQLSQAQNNLRNDLITDAKKNGYKDANGNLDYSKMPHEYATWFGDQMAAIDKAERNRQTEILMGDGRHKGSVGFQFETVDASYGQQIQGFQGATAGDIGGRLGTAFGTDYTQNTTAWDQAMDVYKHYSGVYNGSSIKEILKGMDIEKGELENLYDWYTSHGYQVPESVVSGLKKFQQLEALSGDEHAIWQEIADATLSDPASRQAYIDAKNAGKSMPVEFENAIEEQLPKTSQRIQQLVAAGLDPVGAKESVIDKIKNGTFKGFARAPEEERTEGGNWFEQAKGKAKRREPQEPAAQESTVPSGRQTETAPEPAPANGGNWLMTAKTKAQQTQKPKNPADSLPFEEVMSNLGIGNADTSGLETEYYEFGRTKIPKWMIDGAKDGSQSAGQEVGSALTSGIEDGVSVAAPQAGQSAGQALGEGISGGVSETAPVIGQEAGQALGDGITEGVSAVAPAAGQEVGAELGAGVSAGVSQTAPKAGQQAGQTLGRGVEAGVKDVAPKVGQSAGNSIGEGIKSGVASTAPAAAEGARRTVETQIRSKFASPFPVKANVHAEAGNVTVSGDVRQKVFDSLRAQLSGGVHVTGVPITVSGTTTVRTNVPTVSKSTAAPPRKAYGGRFTSASIIEVAESGDNEYAIPINSMLRSAKLWEAAGRELLAAGAPIDFGRIQYDGAGLRVDNSLDVRPQKRAAYGGRFTSPMYIEIGEGNDDEYDIPINRSARSARLWEAAGLDLFRRGAPVSFDLDDEDMEEYFSTAPGAGQYLQDDYITDYYRQKLGAEIDAATAFKPQTAMEGPGGYGPKAVSGLMEGNVYIPSNFRGSPAVTSGGYGAYDYDHTSFGFPAMPQAVRADGVPMSALEAVHGENPGMLGYTAESPEGEKPTARSAGAMMGYRMGAGFPETAGFVRGGGATVTEVKEPEPEQVLEAVDHVGETTDAAKAMQDAAAAWMQSFAETIQALQAAQATQTGNTQTINYNPHITVNGGTSKDDVQSADMMAYQQFVSFFEQYQKDVFRTSP